MDNTLAQETSGGNRITAVGVLDRSVALLDLLAAGPRSLRVLSEAAIYVDADFLIGPEAAHLNITGVSGLATRWGSLNLRVSASTDEVRVHVDGAAAPPGGFAIPWPGTGVPSSVRVNGREVRAEGEVRVPAASLPADVVMRGSGLP